MAHNTKTPKAPWFYVRDTRGYPSLSVTLVVVSFAVTTVAYVLSIFDHIGTIAIRPFDVAACSTYMIPCIAHYWARKQTDASATTAQVVAGAAPAQAPPPSAVPLSSSGPR